MWGKTGSPRSRLVWFGHGKGAEAAGRQPGIYDSSWAQHLYSGRAQSGSNAGLSNERAAAATRSRLSFATDSSGLVRNDAGQVAFAHLCTRSTIRRPAHGT